MHNLDLLADACRRRFEGSYEDFRAALDAAYPTITDCAGPDWDEPPTDGPGDDSPEDGPSELVDWPHPILSVDLSDLAACVAELRLPRLGDGPPCWFDTPDSGAVVSPDPAGQGGASLCDVHDCPRPGDVLWPVGGRYTVLLCAWHALEVV